MSIISKITAKGLASQSQTNYPVYQEDLNKSLLNFLINDLKLPIASSCEGKQICMRCKFNQKKLLCAYKVKDYLEEEIIIDYL